ncbi:hypothetical protein B0570_004439 [Salmonella enterica subsp. enterica serovar Benue]|nr:hypothetical protein [Salmonella enterica subsp. enterica serovar Benue]MIW33674.1 hypothetical protein [Salmonella enterica subsp. enterica serovar Derby]
MLFCPESRFSCVDSPPRRGGALSHILPTIFRPFCAEGCFVAPARQTTRGFGKTFCRQKLFPKPLSVFLSPLLLLPLPRRTHRKMEHTR